MIEFRTKEARQTYRLIELAFKSGSIKQDTFDAGLTYVRCMDIVRSQVAPAPAKDAYAVAREVFDRLFERDTSGNGVEPRGAAS